MSETANNPYLQHVRELKTRVYLGFYQNTGEDIGEACVNREGWAWNASNEVVAPQSDPFHNKSMQILTYGLSSYKYATVDGKTKLDGTTRIAGESPDVIIGLWSDVVSDAATGTFTAKKPAYVVKYSQERLLSELNVIGCRAWDQYPVEYDLIVYTPAQTTSVMAMAAQTAAPRILANVSETLTAEGVVSGDQVKFHITGATAIDQTIIFTDGTGQPITLTTQKIELVIYKWSEPGAVAKIMFFSRDRSVSYTERDVKSITVYEEKTASMDELTFGVSSNSCSVEVSNASGIFDANADFLRRGKLVIPSVGIKDQEGYQRLGKFYSESWERSTNSKFITCKAYDILYGLQNITLRIPYTGDLTTGFHARTFASVYDAYAAIFDAINEEKHRNETYGADIEYVIDESLKNLPFTKAFFEEKSAWDVLQELSDYCMSHVYTDREGIVHVKYDMSTAAVSRKSGLQIDPSNAFSFSLPVQSRTIVNKITVPYRYAAEGKAEDNTIEISKEKIITQNGVMTFSVDLINYYPNGFNFTLYYKKGDNNPEIPINELINGDKTKVYYNKISFLVNEITDFDSLLLEIIPQSGSFKVLKEDKYTYQADDGMASIKKNGVCLLEYPSSPFIDADAAKRIATSIINKYNDGVGYVETDWAGTPELAISDVINCYSLQDIKNGAGTSSAETDTNQYAYESYSNEFTINSGLRVKSKLRKI